MPRVVRPATANKKSNAKNNKGVKYTYRLSPRECREVKTYWEETVEMKATTNKETGSNGRSRCSYRLPLNVVKNVTTEKLDRRNPGRGDGATWNADSFICSDQIEGEDREEDGDDGWDLDGTELEHEHYYYKRRQSGIISLADVIRAAKPNKVRVQEFEMIPTVTRVILADDDASTSYSGWEDDLEYFEDEEWEQLESSSEAEEEPSPVLEQKSYAQALLPIGDRVDMTRL